MRWNDVLLQLRPSLPGLRRKLPSLFGWFTGITAQFDLSSTCTSAVRFVAFADRPSHTREGVLEISRFSCMLFLSVRGLLDCAGPNSYSAAVWPSSYSEGSRHPDLLAFRSSITPAHQCLRPTLRNSPRDGFRKTRSQDGVAISFSVGLLHPLQHAGLARRSPDSRFFRPLGLLLIASQPGGTA